MLPTWVLERAQKELLEYKDTGQSVMEMSHRSPEYMEIHARCQNSIRELLGISDDYHVFFVQGGASLQFSMIPMNLAENKVLIVNTGEWTKKAYTEHIKIVPTEIIADSEPDSFSYIPHVTEDMVDQTADYLYICQNNTIFGTAYPQLPQSGKVPLVADLSSMICSEPMDIDKYGLIFAGTQKNMGTAGVCVVILRKDMLKPKNDKLPTMLNYYTYIENDSLFNTPPTYAIYLSDLVCRWIREEIGGLENMKKLNNDKAALLYEYLDVSDFFRNPVNKEDRSMMNVTFVSPSTELDKLFIKEAAAAGFINLAGHRLVGGMRASIYNAMPSEGIKALVEFMKDFEVNHG